jgi:type IV pilus assembly protein PilV
MSPNRTPRRDRVSLQGFTLIEVMIALLIFSVGILGSVALQAKVVQMATQNSDRARAAVLANEMVSQLWANQSSTPTSTYLTAWQGRVSDPTVSGLPNGLGSVTACAGVANCAQILVTWQATSAKSGSQLSNYTTTVVIQ